MSQATSITGNSKNLNTHATDNINASTTSSSSSSSKHHTTYRNNLSPSTIYERSRQWIDHHRRESVVLAAAALLSVVAATASLIIYRQKTRYRKHATKRQSKSAIGNEAVNANEKPTSLSPPNIKSSSSTSNLSASSTSHRSSSRFAHADDTLLSSNADGVTYHITAKQRESLRASIRNQLNGGRASNRNTDENETDQSNHFTVLPAISTESETTSLSTSCELMQRSPASSRAAFEFTTGEELLTMLQSTLQMRQYHSTDDVDADDEPYVHHDQRADIDSTINELKYFLTNNQLDPMIMEIDAVKLSIAHWITIVTQLQQHQLQQEIIAITHTDTNTDTRIPSSILQLSSKQVQRDLLYAFNLLNEIDDSSMQVEDDASSEQQRFVMGLRASIAKQLSQPSLLHDVYHKSKLLLNPTASLSPSDRRRSRYSVNSKGHIVANRYSDKHQSRAKGNIGFVDHMRSIADYQLLLPLSALVADWRGFIAMCRKFGGDIHRLVVDSYDVPDLQFLYQLVSHLQQEWTSLPQYEGNNADDEDDENAVTLTLQPATQSGRREYKVTSLRIKQEIDDSENIQSSANQWREKLIGSDNNETSSIKRNRMMKVVSMNSLILLGYADELETLCVGVVSDLYSYNDVKQRQYVLAGRAVLFDEDTQCDTLQIERYYLRGRLNEEDNHSLSSNGGSHPFLLSGQYVISQQVLADQGEYEGAETSATTDDVVNSSANVSVNEWRYQCEIILQPLDG